MLSWLHTFDLSGRLLSQLVSTKATATQVVGQGLFAGEAPFVVLVLLNRGCLQVRQQSLVSTNSTAATASSHQSYRYW